MMIGYYAKYGGNVVTLSIDGTDAWKQFQEHEFDLVVLDGSTRETLCLFETLIATIWQWIGT